MAEQVKVTITAQDGTRQGIKSAEDNLEQLRQKTDETAASIQGKATAAFAALTVAIGGAVKLSMDFEAAMDRVAAISQATGGQFDALKETALKMGAETVYSATQAADALTYLAQAGFDTGQQVEAIPGVLNMAAVEMMDLGQAADIGSAILAGFNLKAAEMGQVADILTAASVSTNVGITDLGESMKFLGPIASSLGISIQNMTATVGLLGNAGIKGGEAGRQLRGGLTALINPSAEAADVMKALGIVVTDQHGQFKGLSDVLGQFQQATAGMGETQRAATVATVVGQEAMSAFLALMHSGPDAIRGLTTELENSGGAADRIATQQLDNLKGSLEEMKSQFEDAAIAVGDAFNPTANAAVAIITDLLAMIAGVARESPKAVREFGTMALTITAATIAVAGLVRAYISLQAVMGPAGWATLAIGALVGVLANIAIGSKAAALESDRQSDSLINLAQQYRQATAAVDNATASEAGHKKATDDQKKAIAEIGAAFPELVKRWDEHGQAVELDTDRLNRNTEAALKNKKAKGEGELQDLDKAATDAYENLLKGENDRDQARARAYESVQRKLSVGAITQAEADATLAEDYARIDEQTAKGIRDAQTAFDRAAAKMAQKQAELGNPTQPPDWLPQAEWAGVPAKPSGAGTSGPPPGSHAGGGNQMSAGLKKDLDELADLQALEHTPDNLKLILIKTREIISAHYAELEKMDRLREMQRTAQITLPNEIAQAEYNAALSKLDADKTLKNLSPEQFAQGLRGIKDRFSAYLQAHPDLALQMDLRLKGATDEELRAPLDAQREAMRRIESLGGFDGTGGIERKLLMLRQAMSLAVGAGDQGAVAEFTGQIKQIEKAISDANFTEKFDAIKKAREAAFVSAAGALAQLQMDLDDEQAKGDKADPQRIAALKQAVLNAVRPALEAEQAALIALRDSVMADKTLSEETRAKRVTDIESQLNGVRSDLYAQDVDAHRIATEAKTAAEKAAAKERTDAQKAATDALSKAEKDALDQLKADSKAAEDALDARIKAKEKELAQYDRQIAQEDRLKKIEDARAERDRLRREGEQEEVLLADGTKTMRTRGLAEAEKALADAIQEDQRAREKEKLQDEITAMREELQALRDSNKEQEDELQKHFQAAKDAVTQGFTEMDTAQGAGLETMKTNLGTELDGLLGKWSRYAEEAKRIINSIPSGEGPPAAGAPSTSPGSPSSGGGGAGAAPDSYQRGNGRAFGTGAYVNRPQVATVGDRPETIVPDEYLGRLAGLLGPLIDLRPPTMPAIIGRGAGTWGPQQFQATLQVNVTASPGTPDANYQAARQGAFEGGQAAIDAFVRGGTQRQIGGTRTT